MAVRHPYDAGGFREEFTNSDIKSLIKNPREIMTAINVPEAFYVPVIGWARGTIHYSFTGDMNLALTYLGVQVAALCAIVTLVYFLSNDYYEEAATMAENFSATIKAVKAGKKDDGKMKKVRRVAREMNTQGPKTFAWKAKLVKSRLGFSYLVDLSTLIYFAIGIIAIVADKTLHLDFDVPFPYFICGALMYGILLIGVSRSEEKDFTKHYFFLAPGRAIKKLFYISYLDVVRFFIGTLFLTVPMVVYSGFDPLMLIALLAFMNTANLTIVATGILTRIIFKSSADHALMLPFIKIFTILFVLLPNVIGMAFVGSIMGSLNLAFLAAGFLNTIIAFVIFGLSDIIFDRMEL
jgi:hypothetical protein